MQTTGHVPSPQQFVHQLTSGLFRDAQMLPDLRNARPRSRDPHKREPMRRPQPAKPTRLHTSVNRIHQRRRRRKHHQRQRQQLTLVAPIAPITLITVDVTPNPKAITVIAQAALIGHASMVTQDLTE